MLLGAPMSDLAFAAPTILSSQEVALTEAKGLANGVKFVLKTTNGGFVTVKNVTDTDFVTKDAVNESSLAKASVFEIRNYSNKTFELWVNGKQFVTKGANAATNGNDVNKIFYARNSSGVYDKADFAAINTAVLGGVGEEVYSASAYTKKTRLDAETLNKNISGKGFYFQFPGATVAPDKNPFANQMVAVDADDINPGSTGLMFAIADEAGLKLLETPSADNVNAATFVMVSPEKNFGITGFDKANGEGYDFILVKGDKLDANNTLKDGKIAYDNGIYTITEDDVLGAPGQYTIKMSSLKVKDGSNENKTASNLLVGAYSLTDGGLKTYITTFADTRKYAKAQTTGNTWAKAADILKTNGPAIYNIYFTGTQPDDQTTSLYGKYYVSNYGASDFVNVAVAPKDVNVKAPAAQWVVTGMGSNDGYVLFKNLETNETASFYLYKTDKAGIYDVYNGQAYIYDVTSTNGVKLLDVEQIRLTPAVESDGFLTLTDAQLKQKAELIFNGSNNLVVDQVYMTYSADDKKYIPVSDADKSQYWTLVEAESVKNEVDYVYLNNNEIATKEDSTLLTIQAYYLTTKNATKETVGLVAGNGYTLAAVGNDIAANLDRFVFKKNVNGTYTVITIAKSVQLNDDNAATNYGNVVKYDASKLIVNQTAGFIGNTVISAQGFYSDVTFSMTELGESLEGKPRHATFEGDNGAISFKANNAGILEGIIAAEGLTFWLDTADSQAELPTFYISKGIATAEEDSAETKAAAPATMRNFMYYAYDSLYYWNESKAAYDVDVNYALEGAYAGNPTKDSDVKAVFRAAALTGIDTLTAVVDGENIIVAEDAKEDVCLGGLDNFKFYITKADNGYVISPKSDVNKYLYNLNGRLGFTSVEDQALVVTLGAGDPTANESVAEAVESVKVVGGNGYVEIQGAAGKNVVVTNILGKVIANTVLTSDNQTINVPAGIVVVAVEGEEAAKAVVK